MSITRSIFLSLSLALSTCLAAAPLPEVLSFLKGYDSRPGVRATILVRDLQTGETILSHRSDETFRPASLVKIATTGAFLSMRGRDYRFHMPIALRGELVDSTWRGDLILGASADPSLGSHYIAGPGRLVRQVRDLLLARGIKRISGRLLLDMAGFPPPYYSEHWPDEDLDHYYAVPVSGFSLADNYADLYLYDEGEGLGVELQLAGLPLPYQKEFSRGATNHLNLSLHPKLHSLMLAGSVRVGRQGTYLRQPLSDPPAFAAHWLSEGLRGYGIPLEQTPQVVYGTEPMRGLDTIGFYRSLAADTLARITNFRSANGYAEALAYVLNDPQDRASGQPVAMRRFWQERLGLTDASFFPQDGSGLSPTGGLTSEALTRILADLWANPKVRRSFLASLPRAGVEGTVRSLDVPSEITAYLKSGSMRGVRGYAGYVQRDEKWYSVVYIANGSIVPEDVRSTFTRLLTGLFTDRSMTSSRVVKESSPAESSSSEKKVTRPSTKRRGKSRR